VAEIRGDTFDWFTKVKNVIPDWKLLDPLASNQADLLDLLCKSLAAFPTSKLKVSSLHP
jgi:hypothetical protein